MRSTDTSKRRPVHARDRISAAVRCAFAGGLLAIALVAFPRPVAAQDCAASCCICDFIGQNYFCWWNPDEGGYQCSIGSYGCIDEQYEVGYEDCEDWTEGSVYFCEEIGDHCPGQVIFVSADAYDGSPGIEYGRGCWQRIAASAQAQATISKAYNEPSADSRKPLPEIEPARARQR